MLKSSTILSWIFLFSVLLSPSYASAFEWKKGDQIKVEKGEVINDDLYITARSAVIDGNINGDLVVFAQKVVINGMRNDFSTMLQTTASYNSLSQLDKSKTYYKILDTNVSNSCTI